MSSIRINSYGIGYRAAELLEGTLGGAAAPSKVILIPPGEVVTRQNSDTTAIEDMELATAMRFIQENVERSPSVQMVLDHGGMSRRPLEKRFRSALRRTILEEIHRAQVERVRVLLIDKALTLHQVARQFGFRNATRLGIVFRRVMGGHAGELPSGACGARVRERW